MAIEFYLFLPQMRMTMDDIAGRARAAEAAGFTGIAGMDHLAPPNATATPMYEAFVTTTWLAAHTKALRVGSLVLCDALRHPAVLANQAVSVDHASGGRFDLGLGWGSVPAELASFGAGPLEPSARLGRMRETLEIVKALWSGETVDYSGEYFTLKGAQQAARPSGPIPIVIGGAGPRTMELVAAHADWWNLHVGILDRLDDMRERAGRAQVSLQAQVAFVPSPDRREEIEATARRRFGPSPVVGSGAELVDYFAGLAERGVERAYVWFCDFAVPATLEAFGREVVAEFSRP